MYQASNWILFVVPIKLIFALLPVIYKKYISHTLFFHIMVD